MRKFVFALALAVPSVVFAASYTQIQSTAEISTSPASRFVSVHIHLRNIGDSATACTVKAGGQSRKTGLSIGGEADVVFDSISNYKGYSVSCSAN
jgi:hypothetical protein